jgi:hypothetical protein
MAFKNEFDQIAPKSIPIAMFAIFTLKFSQLFFIFLLHLFSTFAVTRKVSLLLMIISR